MILFFSGRSEKEVRDQRHFVLYCRATMGVFQRDDQASRNKSRGNRFFFMRMFVCPGDMIGTPARDQDTMFRWRMGSRTRGRAVRRCYTTFSDDRCLREHAGRQHQIAISTRKAEDREMDAISMWGGAVVKNGYLKTGETLGKGCKSRKGQARRSKKEASWRSRCPARTLTNDTVERIKECKARSFEAR